MIFSSSRYNKMKTGKIPRGEKALFYCGQNLIMGRHTAHNLATPLSRSRVHLAQLSWTPRDLRSHCENVCYK
jgi:hypothetical protein